jgi:hypothetical protein
MDCKEHLLYFFTKGKISLSQYDHKFLANLQMILHRDKRVTTNQANLFDKLIGKYAKQLSKNGYNSEQLLVLPWKSLVVESTVEYTGARVSLENDTLVVKVPFNKNFIADFRDIPHNMFEWNREDKRYKSEFSTSALKILYYTLPKYFPSVTYCDTLNEIFSELTKFEAKYWEPTLTSINDRLTIVAVNYILGDLIKDIELDLNPKTIYKLSMLGIKVDPSLMDNPKLNFAGNFEVEVDLDELATIAEWIKELGAPVIYGRGLTTTARPIQLEVKKIFDTVGVYALHERDLALDTHVQTSNKFNPMVIQYYKHKNDVRFYNKNNISKYITITNKRPVDIK